jgi:hypothetical protein
MGRHLSEALDRNRRVQEELTRLLRAVASSLPARQGPAPAPGPALTIA